MIDILVSIEIAVAVIIAILNVKEIQFLRELAIEGRKENLWLLKAISMQQLAITVVGIYLLVLTGLSAFVGPLTEYFPGIRVINGLLILIVIGSPVYIGHEMRKRRNGGHS